MVIRDADENYAARTVSLEESDRLVFKWRHKKGDYFFVVASALGAEDKIDVIVEKMQEDGLDDEAILNCKQFRLYADDSAGIRVYGFTARRFEKDGCVWKLAASELASQTPYKFSVYVCEKVLDDRLAIYRATDNYAVLKQKVRYTVDYKKAGFLSSSNVAIVRVERVENYIDGSICYSVDGNRIPLTAAALGQELTISIPKDSRVSVNMSDELEEYYMLTNHNR